MASTLAPNKASSSKNGTKPVKDTAASKPQAKGANAGTKKGASGRAGTVKGAKKGASRTAAKGKASTKALVHAKKPGTIAKATKKSTKALANAVARVRAAGTWIADNAHTPKVIIPTALLSVYIMASLFFSSHYLPGTTINGHNVSLRSAATATKVAQSSSEGYATTVTGDGISLTLTATDIDLAFDADAFTDGATSHLPGWAWPVIALLNRNYDVPEGVTYNNTKLKAIVNPAVKAANKGTTSSQNAGLSYDESIGSFVASEERQGDSISETSVLTSVAHGVRTLQEQIELGSNELEHPSLLASDPNMAMAIQEANARANQSLELTVKGKTVHTVDPELLRTWIALDDSYKLTGDLEAITDWARGDLSAEVDTVGTARTYTRTSDGKRIEVFGGGTYGWNMDSAALAKLISKHVSMGSTEPIEIPMQSTADVYVHGSQDWGPRYVDVDLTEQYVIMFDEDSNIIMESACVTGDIEKNNETVTGVFMIEKKESPATLIGLDYDNDGEPDYENDVEYWMPFYGGYGLHDALWRDYFGSDVNQYGGGSHGCVNLPYYAAELLYENVEVGDVVVVHY